MSRIVTSEIVNHIDSFGNHKILVIGDLMLDEFVHGKVERLSPEAPVPVLLETHSVQMPGGAGNVAANIASLGGKCTFVGAIGDDPRGTQLADIFNDMGIDCKLFKIPNFVTTLKQRFIANGKHHLMRRDNEMKMPPMDAENFGRMKTVIERYIARHDIVLLSDYDKGVLSNVTTQMIISAAESKKKPVVIDPKIPDWTRYAGKGVTIKPNLKEYNQAVAFLGGQPVEWGKDDYKDRFITGANMLLAKYNIGNIFVTMSEHGMVCFDKNNPGELIHIPTQAHEVSEVSGAGDTAMATIGIGLASGMDFEDAMITANYASGIVVEQMGTVRVKQRELRAKILYAIEKQR